MCHVSILEKLVRRQAISGGHLTLALRQMSHIDF
jgi:hypothetical protein